MLLPTHARSVLTLLLLAALPSLGHGAETVFGLTLGEPVQLSPCGGHEQFPAHPKEGFCITPASLRKLTNEEGGATGIASALFKYNDLPFWTLSRLDLVVSGEKLVGIISRTGGRTTHLSVTTDLNKRFGQPTRTVQNAAQTQLGASFDNTISMWQVGDLLVTYIPLLGDIKTGQVDLFLPAGLELYRRINAEKTPSPSRPL
jgi:hypothetical protein